jgi:hypothetical protein
MLTKLAKVVKKFTQKVNKHPLERILAQAVDIADVEAKIKLYERKAIKHANY